MFSFSKAAFIPAPVDGTTGGIGGLPIDAAGSSSQVAPFEGGGFN